ncbi:MAG: IS110 family transposase [Calditrichaeota bacterium]|nr:IS110 family transposase [Calditrichota bacterium]
MENFYMGCDVSKGYADFVIIDQNKKLMEPVFQIDDTFDGHNQLYTILSKFLTKHPGATLYCAVESTGGLEDNWLKLLHRLSAILSVRAARINPMGPHNLHKASMVRNGTDAISAQLIAEYLIAFADKVRYNETDPYVSLRKQWNLIEMYKKQKTQLLNQLSLHLYTAVPFLVHYCKYGVPRWILLLLKAYPSASKIARARTQSLHKIPYVSVKRAQTLAIEAKHSVGAVDDPYSALVIQSIVSQILHLEKLINQHKRYMTQHCQLPQVQLLTSFKGIGIYSAVGLMLNIISVERFPSAKNLASYFGLHPVYKRSGDSKEGVYMSKKGRSAPREILYWVAKSAIVSNPLIKEFYQRHIKNGKTKMSALGICMHKIARIVFGMLKHQKPFDPAIDRRNTHAGSPAQVRLHEFRNKRRFQKTSDVAPISRRQVAIRKERKLSQLTESEPFGICASSPSNT